MSSTRPCITRTFQGGEETVTFDEFASLVVQDDEVAAEVAERMLASNAPYAWNVDDPEFFETFTVVDCDALRAQLAAAGA